MGHAFGNFRLYQISQDQPVAVVEKSLCKHWADHTTCAGDDDVLALRHAGGVCGNHLLAKNTGRTCLRPESWSRRRWIISEVSLSYLCHVSRRLKIILGSRSSLLRVSSTGRVQQTLPRDAFCVDASAGLLLLVRASMTSRRHLHATHSVPQADLAFSKSVRSPRATVARNRTMSESPRSVARVRKSKGRGLRTRTGWCVIDSRWASC